MTRAVRSWRAPRLVLTSPPYPGVHVLYHRWQVDGRKEAPLPFMIADKLDGAGSSYYTMGDRKYPELRTYFDRIRATMSSIAMLADKHTVVVQMVAFSDASWQLPRTEFEHAASAHVELALHEGDRVLVALVQRQDRLRHTGWRLAFAIVGDTDRRPRSSSRGRNR